MQLKEFKIKIDKQGRLVIPSAIRKLLGIKGETEGKLSVRGRKIIIELEDTRYKKRIDKWYQKIKNLSAQAFSSEETPSFSWMSEEYVKKKLGLD